MTRNEIETAKTLKVSRDMAAELLALYSQRAGEFDPRLISDTLIVKCRRMLGMVEVPTGQPMRMVQVKRDWFEIGQALSSVRHQLFTGGYVR